MRCKQSFPSHPPTNLDPHLKPTEINGTSPVVLKWALSRESVCSLGGLILFFFTVVTTVKLLRNSLEQYKKLLPCHCSQHFLECTAFNTNTDNFFSSI